jgi:hypothetical protein
MNNRRLRSSWMPVERTGGPCATLRSEAVTFDFPHSLWSESLEEHLPTSMAGVLRLRAVNPSLCDGSTRRFAQDDDFVEWPKTWLGVQKTRKDRKVTGSRDDNSFVTLTFPMDNLRVCSFLSPLAAGKGKSSGSHRSDALYQGTTLVGPFRRNKYLGFSPCAFFFAR